MRHVAPLVLALLGCGEPAAPVAPAEPPTVAHSTFAAAGLDPDRLCDLVRESPDAPESAHALTIVEEVRIGSLAGFHAGRRERDIPAWFSAALDSFFASGAENPCARWVGVAVDHTSGNTGPWIETAVGSSSTVGAAVEGWSDWAGLSSRVGTAIAAPLGTLLGRWPRVTGDSGGAELGILVHVAVVIDGTIGLGDRVYPALAFDPSLELVGTALGEPTFLSLPRVHLPADFVAAFYGDGRTPAPGPDVIAEELGLLSTRLEAELPRALRLADPDPVLAGFTSSWTLEPSTAAGGCGAPVELAAHTIMIDPVRRSVFADGVDRTYPARAEGEGFVAEERFVDPDGCVGASIVERWSLAPRPDGALAGTLASTRLLPPACDTPCTATFELVARPTSP